MPIVEASPGGNTITTLEWSIAGNVAGPTSNTSMGTYWAVVDLTTLVANDSFEIRTYEKARAGDTQRRTVTYSFSGSQADPLFITPPLPLMNGWDITLVKTAGTDRLITWSIRKYT
jgi:hypothetical protein